MYDHPEELWQAAWQLLTRANNDRKHAFRTATVSTVTLDGAPDARTVVMRKADQSQWTLRMYTDRRSNKVAALKANPKLHWLCWDPKKQIQFSGLGEVSFWSDENSADLFNQLPKHGRKAYATVNGPGEALNGRPDGLPQNWEEMTTEQTEYAKENFLVAETKIFKADVLHLDRDYGNRRLQAAFTDGAWKLNLVVP